MDKEQLVIRPFIESDRETLRNILKNEASYTTKGGKNANKKECLCYMYSDYYFDYEPQNVLVSVYEGAVCGFVVVSTDTELFRSRMIEEYIPKIRRYTKVWAFFHRICVDVNTRQEKNGGAAFHINIDHNFQGKRIGTNLMAAVADHLKSSGKKYLFLVTEGKHTAGYKFYSRIGFHVTRKYIGGSVMMAKDI